MLVGQALDKVREKFGEEAGVKSFRMIGMPQAASFSTWHSENKDRSVALNHPNHLQSQNLTRFESIPESLSSEAETHYARDNHDKAGPRKVHCT